MVYVLYNISSGGSHSEKWVEDKVNEFFPGEAHSLNNTICVDDKREFIKLIGEFDKLLIIGGDGTLNHFVNGIDDEDCKFPIYYLAGGTGNDFLHDICGEKTDGLVMINDYIRSLPSVEVNGKKYRFINGIGYGIDGYCCEVGDDYRERTGKAPNYTAIAIKGLLFKFKKVNAAVTIDGVTEKYKNVWMVPAMNGRFFGGGMMITPGQDRLNLQREISVAVVSCKSRLRLLTIFPKIFKGEHTKYTKYIKIVKCKSVTVEFDKPTALQIDGETVREVRTYTAKSNAADLCEMEKAEVLN